MKAGVTRGGVIERRFSVPDPGLMRKTQSRQRHTSYSPGVAHEIVMGGRPCRTLTVSGPNADTF